MCVFVPILATIIGCLDIYLQHEFVLVFQSVIGFINGFFRSCAGTILMIIISGTLYCVNEYFCCFESDTSAGSTTTETAATLTIDITFECVLTTPEIVTMIEGDENIVAGVTTPKITVIENLVKSELETLRWIFRTTNNNDSNEPQLSISIAYDNELNDYEYMIKK